MSKQALGADINEFYNNILPDDCTVEYMADYISDIMYGLLTINYHYTPPNYMIWTILVQSNMQMVK